ncbi:MAG: ATP-binding protein [Bdellovibrionales bacterium]
MPTTELDALKQLQDQKFALDQSAIVAQTDARGIITMVNDKFCQISGYSRAELIGHDHRVVNSGTHSKEFFRELWHTIRSGRVWRGEVCNRKKSGELYWVATTITPFLDANQQPYQYLAIRQDITALMLAKQRIEEQEAQLVSASRLSAIGEMAAAITHEINNPLAVILGRTEMISSLVDKNQLNPEVLKRLVDTIYITGKRIERIVRSMKTLAYSGSDEEPFALCSVKEILTDSLELCSQRFENHGIQMQTPKIEDSWMIECRSHQIVQVLVNLMNNAHDAVKQLDDRWVKVELQIKNDLLEISVTDSGQGIPSDVVPKLFDPFFSTKRVQYGTGLGLSISKSLIAAHQGELLYDASNPNTRFVMRLPTRHKKTNSA